MASLSGSKVNTKVLMRYLVQLVSILLVLHAMINNVSLSDMSINVLLIES